MVQPKVRATLSIDSIPFKIPGNSITRGNVTVFTSEDFPQTPDDQYILVRLLNFQYVIRNPIVVEFARVRDKMWALITTGPTHAQAAGEETSKYFLRVEKNFYDLLKVIEEVYGQIELKSREEMQQDSWLRHRDDGQIKPKKTPAEMLEAFRLRHGRYPKGYGGA